MIIAYVACPYSAKTQADRNYRHYFANQVSAKLLQKGYMVFSPISMCHPIALLNKKLKTDAETYKEFNHKMMDQCQELWVVKAMGWDKSLGVKDELEYARATGKKIRYCDVEGNETN